jgi:DNA-binding NarL/FixJ family response regulator
MPLTDRELQVLRLVANGRGNPAIAAELYLSTATVKSHLQRIRAKLGARDRAHAAALGMAHGLLERGDVQRAA